MANVNLLEQVSESKRRIKSMVGDLNEVKMDLKSMLDWSDRIGSDERHQLNQTRLLKPLTRYRKILQYIIITY